MCKLFFVAVSALVVIQCQAFFGQLSTYDGFVSKPCQDEIDANGVKCNETIAENWNNSTIGKEIAEDLKNSKVEEANKLQHLEQCCTIWQMIDCTDQVLHGGKCTRQDIEVMEQFLSLGVATVTEKLCMDLPYRTPKCKGLP